MNLYIETKNGVTKNHPALENNLIEVFGAIPEYWEPFTRVEYPTLGVYQTMDSNEPVYTKIDGVWTDVWSVRDMTTEEKTTKQQAVIDLFNSREQFENWSAWTLDEATRTMIPPIARPDFDETKFSQGIMTFWCGADANWKDAPVRPEGEYKFDFIAWAWIAA